MSAGCVVAVVMDRSELRIYNEHTDRDGDASHGWSEVGEGARHVPRNF